MQTDEGFSDCWRTYAFAAHARNRILAWGINPAVAVGSRCHPNKRNAAAKRAKGMKKLAGRIQGPSGASLVSRCGAALDCERLTGSVRYLLEQLKIYCSQIP